jgi:tRNA (guanine37-N1)-methyltransferase
MIPLKGNLKEILAEKLEPQQLRQIYKTYDIVGDIAIVRVSKLHRHLSKLIAEAIMSTHVEVKAVWRQSSSVSGDYRLRSLEFLLGEKRTETLYKEHGCVYKTNLRKAYFSPRLSYERLRIAKLIQPEEVVLNMFAGVGCYSISIARAHIVDRVLMLLPERSYEYLDYALLALKPAGGWIYYYCFEYAKRNEDPVGKAEMKMSKKMRKLCANFQVEFGRIVRPIGPRWYQVVLDIHVKN